MYTIEMARARMRELQELADRSRRHRTARHPKPHGHGRTAR